MCKRNTQNNTEQGASDTGHRTHDTQHTAHSTQTLATMICTETKYYC